MKSLWNEQTVAEATKGEARGHFVAARVEIDSRKVQLGDLFVAIKGERVDGHHYVADALNRGAVAAVVSHVPEGLPRGVAIVVVGDTLEALTAMARYSRAKTQAKIVGVTGSVGKTSTKDMLRLALAAHGKTIATTGNYNNHIGTPLNLCNLPVDAAFGVFEMGMNHEGEIRHLTKIVKPHVAVITNIEAVHLEFFRDVEAIAEAKAEIFEGVTSPSPAGGGSGWGQTCSGENNKQQSKDAPLLTSPLRGEGYAVLNADNPFCDYLRKKAGALNVLTFGEKEGSDARLLSYASGMRGSEIIASINGLTLSFTLKATGRHFANAALSALAVAKALTLPLPKTAAALADFAESDGRGRPLPLKLEKGEAWLIDDSYNASPASMKAAIAKTNELWEMKGKTGRKIAALGDMLELGKDAPQLHAALSDALIANGFHLVLTAGPLMKHLEAALPAELRGVHMMEAKALLPILQKTLAEEDVLLVKGSHGSKMHELAAALARPEDARKHAR